MESAIICRCFVLVFVLGCSASTRTDGAAGGESARVEPVGDPEPENVTPTTPAAATVSYQASTTWINHYQVPCSGWEGKHFCYLVADSENGPWRTEYDPIGGVSLEWGHVYEVALGFVDHGGEVGVDAPSIFTFVSEVRTDRKVEVGSTTFEFRVDPQQGELGYRSLTMTGADSGEISDGTPFVCESSQVCDLLEAALGDEEPFAVSFGYGPELLPLVAVSINR